MNDNLLHSFKELAGYTEDTLTEDNKIILIEDSKVYKAFMLGIIHANQSAKPKEKE